MSNIDVNHNLVKADDFFVAQNYILEVADKAHFPDTKIGSWVQVLKCEDLDSSLWKKVKKGVITGVSMFGNAVDEDDQDPNVEELRKQIDAFKQIVKTLDGTQNEAQKKLIEEAEKKIEELNSEIDKSVETNTLAELNKSIQSLGKVMTKAISKSIKGEEESQADKEININGTKVVVKSTHREIYKGIADIDSGTQMGILNANTTSLFIDAVIESKDNDTLSDITVLPLTKDEKIDKGLIDDLVFKNSADGALTPQSISTAEIDCPTGVLTAAISLEQSTVEFYKDKYGDDAFGAYVEQHIAKKAEKAIRLLLLKGDRASATAKIKGLDGIVKLATTGSDVDEISSDDHGTWPLKFEQALLGFEDDYLEEQSNFVIYVSHRNLVKIRSELAKRQTALGDRLLLESGDLSFVGIPIKGRLMAEDHIVMGLPKFIILGYRTDADLKVEHHGSTWKYTWYLRLRSGFTYIPEFVKVYKILPETPAQT